jgi:NAD(P)-dependent dehydrogenase (short-subunit alcohol dehydrogenase family)
MGRLDDKVCLITGAASGLGRVAAERFAAEGATVVVADVGDGTATVDAITAAGGTATTVHCDVADESSVAAAVDHAVDTHGGLHVLYNNAGVSLGDDDGPENTGVDVWETTLRVNVTGLALCCKHGIPAMLRTVEAGGPGVGRGGASIVNVASFVAHLGAATPQIAYTASKGAVLSMTREIAVIYARQGLRANALCQRRLVHIPMGRFGEAVEIAEGALFLASDESSFMTGQSLLVDGGITAAYTTPE